MKPSAFRIRRTISERSRLQPSSWLRKGVTAVEFAIVTPVFLILVFAGLEFAVIGTIRSTSHNAAYEAARMLVIPGAQANDGIAEAKRILGIVGVDTLTVTVSPTTITDTTQTVEVNISVPYAQNAIFTPWFVGNIVLKSSCKLNTERYDGT
ncbi:MAG: TadE family protein [Fuerstiella sp.]